MVEELLMNVVNAMSNCLDEEQLDKLQNVLYINFHDVRVVEEKNELQATGTDSDTAKMRLFVASKKVSGRQDNTLAQYIREITNCRNALRKNIEDITTMDLRWYFGMLRERNKISTSQVWLPSLRPPMWFPRCGPSCSVPSPACSPASLAA